MVNNNMNNNNDKKKTLDMGDNKFISFNFKHLSLENLKTIIHYSNTTNGASSRSYILLSILDCNKRYIEKYYEILFVPPVDEDNTEYDKQLRLIIDDIIQSCTKWLDAFGHILPDSDLFYINFLYNDDDDDDDDDDNDYIDFWYSDNHGDDDDDDDDNEDEDEDDI